MCRYSGFTFRMSDDSQILDEKSIFVTAIFFLKLETWLAFKDN